MDQERPERTSVDGFLIRNFNDLRLFIEEEKLTKLTPYAIDNLDLNSGLASKVHHLQRYILMLKGVIKDFFISVGLQPGRRDSATFLIEFEPHLHSEELGMPWVRFICQPAAGDAQDPIQHLHLCGVAGLISQAPAEFDFEHLADMAFIFIKV